jgi:putative ABC transport system substrate-binding protein
MALAMLTTLAWLGEGRAQTKVVGVLATPRIQGILDDRVREWYEGLRRPLAQLGWIEGRNVVYEYRSARGTPPRFAEAAAELVRLKVDVIYCDSAPATRAAYAATRTIPIVALDFTNDPVEAGYAQSYGRPGGNLTGTFLDAPEFAGKWLGLLKAVVPALSRVAVLWDPSPGLTHRRALEEVARSLDVRLQILRVDDAGDLDRAFLAFEQPQAVVVLPSPMTWSQSQRVANLTVKHKLAATSMAPPFATAGGLFTYGPDGEAVLERNGFLVAKILNGAKPGDLPIERPTKYTFMVNLKTAQMLNLVVPDSVLVAADTVIR